MYEIMNCPFCGSNDVDYFVQREFFHIKCRDCWARGPESKSMKEAKNLWNKRSNNKKYKHTKQRK